MDRKFIWDIIKTVLFAILITILVISIVTVSLTPVMKKSCDITTNEIGLPHRWSFWGGCQVQENGNWIPLANWRYIEGK